MSAKGQRREPPARDPAQGGSTASASSMNADAVDVLVAGAGLPGLAVAAALACQGLDDDESLAQHCATSLRRAGGGAYLI